MDVCENQLDQLLTMIADHIDPDHCRRVDDRYRRSLAFQDVDHPPLVVQAPFGAVMKLPPPWDRFRRYDYRQTFDRPAAMLQNMLLDRVVPGLLLKDDSPLAIRNNHGTIQIAGLLGGHWQLHDDNYPWVTPVGSRDRLRKLAEEKTPIDLHRGVLSRSLETLKFYREKLAEFPPCDQAVQVSLPDLQGPMDTAEQLWGTEIFYAFEDESELLDQLLARIVEAMIAAADLYRPLAQDRLDPFATTQHGYMIPGRLLIRNDTSIMLSPETYARHVRPHDARLLDAMGGGSIHSCGNWQHLVPGVLDIPGLRGLDFGNPELMDLSGVYRQCRERKIALTRVCPSRQDLESGRALRQYPTGVVFVYATESLDEAQKLIGRNRC